MLKFPVDSSSWIFHAWCLFFRGKFTKSRFFNSFKQKKMNLLRKEKFFTYVVIETKIVHLYCNRVVRVAIVPHSCCSCCICVALVLLVLHLCFTRAALVLLVLTCVTHVLLLLQLCCTRVARVTLVLLVSGTRVLK